MAGQRLRQHRERDRGRGPDAAALHRAGDLGLAATRPGLRRLHRPRGRGRPRARVRQRQPHPVAAGTYSLSTRQQVPRPEGQHRRRATHLERDRVGLGCHSDHRRLLHPDQPGLRPLRRVPPRDPLFLNTPLEPGTAITAQTCDTTNRLQRWQLEKSGDRITLVNAITRMVATFDSNGLIQQVPDGHSPAPLTLTPVVRSTAAIDRRTVAPGHRCHADRHRHQHNQGDRDRYRRHAVRPAGSTVAPSKQSVTALAPGATKELTFIATPPADAPASTVALGAVTSYTQGGATHQLATTRRPAELCAGGDQSGGGHVRRQRGDGRGGRPRGERDRREPGDVLAHRVVGQSASAAARDPARPGDGASRSAR